MPGTAKPASRPLDPVLDRIHTLRDCGLWPNGPRDLWADALGVVCLLSIHQITGEERYLSDAEWVAQEVDRVLGRRRGIRIAEGSDATGQTFRSQALWIYALHRLGQFQPQYKARALALVREIHSPFVRPRAGIISRMEENLTAPFPGSDSARLEVFLGLAVYRQLDRTALSPEIEELEGMVKKTYQSLAPDHGVDLGLLLWVAHFLPGEPWSLLLRERALSALDARWVDPPGYFRRGLSEPWNGPKRSNRLAITNLGVAIGLQAQGLWAHRVRRLHRYFTEEYRWEPEPADALAPILLCLSQNPGLILGG
ncbi:MAG: hypothetical protein ACWGSQ_11945 [Longimicrobiales bacterium]